MCWVMGVALAIKDRVSLESMFTQAATTDHLMNLIMQFRKVCRSALIGGLLEYETIAPGLQSSATL